jgi:RimJ/RimL family protein N-acetyltransferase
VTVAIRALRPEDLELIARWESAPGLDQYVSRTRPRDTLATCHDPQNGRFWFVIVCSGVDVGTVWLEPGEQPDESILGIYLNHSSLFGGGIGSQAIRLAIDECRRRYPAQLIALHVRQGNARAIACYEKVGFVTTSSGTKVLPSGEHLPYFHMQLVPP